MDSTVCGCPLSSLCSAHTHVQLGKAQDAEAGRDRLLHVITRESKMIIKPVWDKGLEEKDDGYILVSVGETTNRLCVHSFIHPPIHSRLSICPSICPPVHPSVHPSTCLFACLFVCPSTCLSIIYSTRLPTLCTPSPFTQPLHA